MVEKLAAFDKSTIYNEIHERLDNETERIAPPPMRRSALRLRAQAPQAWNRTTTISGGQRNRTGRPATPKPELTTRLECPT
jgi:hypothetical protein